MSSSEFFELPLNHFPQTTSLLSLLFIFYFWLVILKHVTLSLWEQIIPSSTFVGTLVTYCVVLILILVQRKDQDVLPFQHFPSLQKEEQKTKMLTVHSTNVFRYAYVGHITGKCFISLLSILTDKSCFFKLLSTTYSQGQGIKMCNPTVQFNYADSFAMLPSLVSDLFY